MALSLFTYNIALAIPFSSNIPIIRKITKVGSNYTIQIDNVMEVGLVFLDTRIKDSQILDDATSLMAVLCPVRSSALVYPDLYSLPPINGTVTKNKVSLGIVKNLIAIVTNI